MRSWFTLVIGFILGVALLTYLGPRTPSGTASPSATDMRVTVSDGYLARRIQARLSGVRLVQVRNVTVTSAPPNELIARANVEVGSAAVPVALGLQPVAEGGAMQVRIVSSQVGQVPVPAVLSNLAAGAVDLAVAHLLPSGMRVVGTSVSDQGLVIQADYPPG